MASVQLPLSYLTEGPKLSESECDENSYFVRHFHTPSSYSRIENWLPDVEEYSFRTWIVPLTHLDATALMRFRDEVKLRCFHRDEVARQNGAVIQEHNQAISDPAALDEFFDFVLSDWPADEQTREWAECLNAFVKRVDEILGECGAAFIKLSTRSPKDSALNLRRTRELIAEQIRNSTFPAGSPEAIEEDIRALSTACWQVLRCTCGRDALKLLVESDRANTDLLCHQLFLEEGEAWNLNVIVREWIDDLDPDWEFRLFVLEGQPTALTVYSSFAYHAGIVEHKAEIQRQILDLFEKVRARIRSSNYTLDFALRPDLTQIWIIEVNDFTPPFAGSALFNYNDPTDKHILFHGPFEFRINEQPRQRYEFTEKGNEDKELQTSLPTALKEFMISTRREVAVPREYTAAAAGGAREESESGCVVS